MFVLTGTEESEIGDMFLRLKNLMVSELHTEWDIAYLEQYISEKLVPRSLWWDVNPQKGDSQLGP